jgi:hypothetical protein
MPNVGDSDASSPAGPRDPDWLPPEINTGVAHSARVYDYWLGGKDNISQVVRGTPHTASTGAVQARYGDYSKTAPLAVRCLFDTCMGIGVRFSGRGFLTLA